MTRNEDDGAVVKEMLAEIHHKIIRLNNSCETTDCKELINYSRCLLNLISQAEEWWGHSCPMADYKGLLTQNVLWGIRNKFLPCLKRIKVGAKDDYLKVYAGLEKVLQKAENAGCKEKAGKIRKDIASIFASVFQSV